MAWLAALGGLGAGAAGAAGAGATTATASGLGALSGVGASAPSLGIALPTAAGGTVAATPALAATTATPSWLETALADSSKAQGAGGGGKSKPDYTKAQPAIEQPPQIIQAQATHRPYPGMDNRATIAGILQNLFGAHT